MSMTEQEIARQAEAWIAYWHAPKKSEERAANGWATDLYDLEYDDPESLWLFILKVHRKDKSVVIQQILSAGPVEALLVNHGDSFIARIESEAKKDPSFAKLLGGVWKSAMSDQNWERLQAVWDRRGWDGIPE